MLEGKGAELVGTESNAPAADTAAARASLHADCDDSEHFATICIGDAGRHRADSDCPEQHGIGSNPEPPS